MLRKTHETQSIQPFQWCRAAVLHESKIEQIHVTAYNKVICSMSTVVLHLKAVNDERQ